eukprot:10159936-Karenia_brevis.AAC.1
MTTQEHIENAVRAFRDMVLRLSCLDGDEYEAQWWDANHQQTAITEWVWTAAFQGEVSEDFADMVSTTLDDTMLNLEE